MIILLFFWRFSVFAKIESTSPLKEDAGKAAIMLTIVQ